MRIDALDTHATGEFALARRGAEIADLDVADLTLVDGGVRVRFGWSNTNQSDEPEDVGLQRIPDDPRCPVQALEAYIPLWAFHAGPLFRTYSHKTRKGNGVAMGDERMTRKDIQRRTVRIAAHAGLPGKWGAHSPRRVFVTSAEAHNVARSRTRIHTGWKNDAMFATYAEHVDVIAHSPLREILAAASLPEEPASLQRSSRTMSADSGGTNRLSVRTDMFCGQVH